MFYEQVELRGFKGLWWWFCKSKSGSILCQSSEGFKTRGMALDNCVNQIEEHAATMKCRTPFD